ncbi:MAG: sterol desaturase family protein [Sphingomonadaceae bacterium]
MSIWTGILLALATIIVMEGIAWSGHRWLMHGPLWCLHKSHHEPRTGRFEKNDWFGVMGAAAAIALFYVGVTLGKGDSFTWVAIGVTIYGAIYFGFHDIIVHRRVNTGYVPRSAYMKRIVQAHRLHHVVESRQGAVSFGFIYAPPVSVLKRQLAENLVENGACRRSSHHVSVAE